MLAVLVWQAPDFEADELVPEWHASTAWWLLGAAALTLARHRPVVDALAGRAHRARRPQPPRPPDQPLPRRPVRLERAAHHHRRRRAAGRRACRRRTARRRRRSPRSCSSGSPAGSSSRCSPTSASSSTPASPTSAPPPASPSPSPPPRSCCSSSLLAAGRVAPLRRPRSPATRAGAASPAPCTSASSGCATTRAPPSTCSLVGFAYQLVLVRRRPVRRQGRRHGRRGRAHRAARLLPRRRHRPGAAGRHLRPRHPRGRVRPVPRAPSACPTEQAVALGLLLYLLNLGVSLLGAPAFAFGGRAAAAGRRRRSPRDGGRDPTAQPPRPPRLRWWREVLYIVVDLRRVLDGAEPVRVERRARRARPTASPTSTPSTSSRSRTRSACSSSGRSSAGTSTCRPTASSGSGTSSTAPPTSSSPPSPSSGSTGADKDRYPTWRNTLAFTTLFALDRLRQLQPHAAPPARQRRRPFGPPPAQNDERDFGFEDTLATYATFWSFDSETLKDVSNQYAAMPSLHIGWSTWSALVLAPMLRRRWLEGARRRCTRSPRCSASW